MDELISGIITASIKARWMCFEVIHRFDHLVSRAVENCFGLHVVEKQDHDV
jgi:hypothetical protein